MNILEPCTIDTPFGDIGECSKFTIDDVLTPFILHNVMDYGRQYTLSLWIKTIDEEITPIDETESTSDEDIEDVTDYSTDLSILVRGGNIPVSMKWARHVHTFSTHSTNLKIYFNQVGTYYIYHPQLERGSVATDWTESPLDTEGKIKDAKDAADKAQRDLQAYIKIFEDTIQSLVTNSEGASLMTQTPDGGWTFCMADTESNVKKISDALDEFTKNTNASLSDLQEAVNKNNLGSYVIINDDDPMNPFIDLGTVVKDENDNLIDGEFKLRITKNNILFMQDGERVAWMSNQELHIQTAVIEDELTVGGFVLKKHGTRNNVGFLWKGVTS